MEKAEAARLLGKLPKAKRYEHACPVCGQTFTGTARGVYCSQLCAWRAANRRRAGKAKAGGDAERAAGESAGEKTAS